MHGEIKEMLQLCRQPVAELTFDELPVVMKFLGRTVTSGDDFYLALKQGKEGFGVFLHPSPDLLLNLTAQATTQNYVMNKFEDFRRTHMRARETADLVVQVHRDLRSGVAKNVES